MSTEFRFPHRIRLLNKQTNDRRRAREMNKKLKVGLGEILNEMSLTASRVPEGVIALSHPEERQQSDEEEGEIISDDENTAIPEETREEAKDEKKSVESRPMSIGDIAARIQEQNALRMASSLDRLQHEEERSRKRHHKKEKRRRRSSHSDDDSPHRKHRRHERKRSRSKSRSRSPVKKSKKEDRMPCKYYMEGKCQKSDDCPYSHAVEPTKRTDLCRFYVSGHCVKRNCPFMHEDFPCKFFHTGAPCFADKSCRYSHAPLTDEMREVLMRYLDECKGLKREDLERLSRKAKEREERHKDPKVLRSYKEPLLELPPTLRSDGSHLGAGDVDLRIPPAGTADVDYRLPVGNDDSPPRPNFYRDTMESPTTSPSGRRESQDPDGSPARNRVADHSNEDKRLNDGGSRHSPRPSIERPTDPRDRSNLDSMSGIPKSQRDLLMRLQQRVETNQDSQGSSQEEGGRTPMPDEDAGEGRNDGDEDSDDDQPLTDVLKRLQQTPSNETTPPAAGSGLDLVKMISSINSGGGSSSSGTSGSTNNQTQSVIGQSNEYWKQLLSIAGVNPATGTSLPSSNQTTPPKVDPRKARDPRQQAQNPPALAAPLPVFPTLEVTTTIESRDGDAPYVLRPIETSPVRYEDLIHLVKMNFRLKSDPRLERHLDKLPKREEVVAESPQSPPHPHPSNYLPQFAGKASLLLAPTPPAADRSKNDPRLRESRMASGASDPRAPAHPMPDLQALADIQQKALGDLRRAGIFPPIQAVGPSGPVARQDPRQAARQDPRQESRPQQSFPQRNDTNTSSSTDARPKTRADPRRRADPRAKNRAPVPQEDPPEGAKQPPQMMYSSPLSVYDDQPPKGASPYPRRNIGRIKKKNQPAAGPSTLSAEETHKSDLPSTSQTTAAPAAAATAPPPAVATGGGSADLDQLPPMPSLLSHPVDSYAVEVEDKRLSEIFKNKDPTASPFD